jgi:hypothetical protein
MCPPTPTPNFQVANSKVFGNSRIYLQNLNDPKPQTVEGAAQDVESGDVEERLAEGVVDKIDESIHAHFQVCLLESLKTLGTETWWTMMTSPLQRPHQ